MHQNQISKPERTVDDQIAMQEAHWGRYNPSLEDVMKRELGRQAYTNVTGKVKDGIHLRDPLYSRIGIEWSERDPLTRPACALLDVAPLQRLRQIAQSSFGHMLFHTMEHSRFPHSVGVANLTIEVLQRNRSKASLEVQKQIEEWGPACVALAILHDVGHIAPRSHIAQRVWFPDQPDMHESVSLRIVNEHLELRHVLNTVFPDRPNFADVVAKVMAEDPTVPEWTWRLVTGGGWNTDRGDWVQRDRLTSKGDFGYDVALILLNLRILEDGKLALKEKGVEHLHEFIQVRARLYKQEFGHKNARIGEEHVVLIGARLRELYREGILDVDDVVLHRVLASSKIEDLPLGCLLQMDDAWWGGIMARASQSRDPVLSFLSKALSRRDLPKMVEDTEENREILGEAAMKVGLDPRYAVMVVPEQSFSYQRDIRNCMPVLRSDGSLCSITEASEEIYDLSQKDDKRIKSHLAAFLEVWCGLA